MSEAKPLHCACVLMMAGIVRIGFRIFAKEFQQRLFWLPRRELPATDFVNIGHSLAKCTNWPPHAIRAPHDLFCGVRYVGGSGQRRPGFHATQFEKGRGVRVSPLRARANYLADHRCCRYKKDKVETTTSEARLFCSLPPATTVTAAGSKYFGDQVPANTSVVAGSASLNVRRQVVPCRELRPMPGRISSSKGPFERDQ